jgi:hypothetical protein
VEFSLTLDWPIFFFYSDVCVVGVGVGVCACVCGFGTQERKINSLSPWKKINNVIALFLHFPQ